jgi:glucose-6-phosphate 1-epimerase
MIASDTIKLSNASGDSAIVSLYGAQVLSWCTASDSEQLYCSSQTDTVAGRAIRGGMPICFPQLGNYGPLVKHGFARVSVWQLMGKVLSGPNHPVASARFSMCDSESTRAVWPYKFSLDLSVTLGPRWMEISLTVTNTGGKVFNFTAALHSYFAVADVRQAAIYGLEMASYLDALNNNARIMPSESPLLIVSETDRVYLDATKPLMITHSGQATLKIKQQRFTDVVVWNPGSIKAAALGDMPADDWTRMLCIEAAQVENPVQLQSGSSWSGLQRLEM